MKAILYSLFSILALCAAQAQPAYVRNISTLKPAAASAPSGCTDVGQEFVTANGITGNSAGTLSTVSYLTAGSSFTACAIVVQFALNASETEPFTFVLRADNSGIPGAVIAASAPVPAATIVAAGTAYLTNNFINPVALTSSTAYWYGMTNAGSDFAVTFQRGSLAPNLILSSSDDFSTIVTNSSTRSITYQLLKE